LIFSRSGRGHLVGRYRLVSKNVFADEMLDGADLPFSFAQLLRQSKSGIRVAQMQIATIDLVVVFVVVVVVVVDLNCAREIDAVVFGWRGRSAPREKTSYNSVFSRVRSSDSRAAS